jgi:deoxyribodipyrimidine photo-lyase
MTQVDKFDKDHKYIKEFVSEFGTDEYPEKMVDHKEARERCLQVYKDAIN